MEYNRGFVRGLLNKSIDHVPVPLKKTTKDEEDTWFNFVASDLPEVKDAVEILTNEDVSVDNWHRVALLYYYNGRSQDFIEIATEGYKDTAIKIKRKSESAVSTIGLLLSIAAYHVQSGLRAGDKEIAKSCFSKATKTYEAVRNQEKGLSGFSEYQMDRHIGEGYMYLAISDARNADIHFSFVLNDLKKDKCVPALLGKGFIAFQRKKYLDALKFFRLALRVNPMSSPANVRIGIGHCLWKLNFRTEAKVAYERAVTLYPMDSNALSALAMFYFHTFQHQSIYEGVKLLQRSYSVEPKHSLTLVLLSDHFYHKKVYDNAFRLANEVLTSNPKDDGVKRRSCFILARCYEVQKDYKNAIRYYYEALGNDLDKNKDVFNLPYYGLARNFLALKDIQQTFKQLDKLLVAEPKNLFAKKMRGCLMSNSLNINERLKAQEYLAPVLNKRPDDIVARIAFATSKESFDDSQAAENYSKALSQHKETSNLLLYPLTHNNFGCSLFRLKRYEEAVNSFLTALQVIDEILDVYGQTLDMDLFRIVIEFNLGRSREALFQFDEAERIYKSILTEHPSYHYCWIRRGIMARDCGNVADADYYLKQAYASSKLQPDPDVLCTQGLLLLSQGWLKGAANKFNKVLTSDPEDSFSLIALGNSDLFNVQHYIFKCEPSRNTYSNNSRNAAEPFMLAAMNKYKKVLSKEPNNIYAANGIGCILACKGLLQEARSVFSEVIDAIPDNRDVLMNIGHTYMEEKEYHRAIKMYERCEKVSVNPDYKILQYIAKAHFLSKDYNKAKNALLKCRRIVPDNNEVLFQLAKVLRKAGWQSFEISSEADQNSSASVAGVNQIELAQTTFLKIQNSSLSSKDLKNVAETEFQYCLKLIAKTPRLEKQLEEKRKQQLKLKDTVDEKLHAYKRNQEKEKLAKEELQKQVEEERNKLRAKTKRRTEKVKQNFTMAEQQAQKRKEKQKKVDKVDPELADFIDDHEESEDENKSSKVDISPIRTRSAPKAYANAKRRHSNSSSSITSKRPRRVQTKSVSQSDSEDILCELVPIPVTCDEGKPTTSYSSSYVNLDPTDQHENNNNYSTGMYPVVTERADDFDNVLTFDDGRNSRLEIADDQLKIRLNDEEFKNLMDAEMFPSEALRYDDELSIDKAATVPESKPEECETAKSRNKDPNEIQILETESKDIDKSSGNASKENNYVKKESVQGGCQNNDEYAGKQVDDDLPRLQRFDAIVPVPNSALYYLGEENAPSLHRYFSESKDD